ncbi:MAG: cellulose synthase subunit BcsC-related outer membrane protein [Nautiliaceae bacterium]
MKKVVLLICVIVELFAYSLVVNDKSDANKLKKAGMNCVLDKNNNYYRCATSNDIAQLKRIQQYIAKTYKINAFIAQDSDTANMVDVKKITSPLKKRSNKKLKTTDIKKTGWCLQISSSTSKNSILRIFKKYRDYPLARVEKIGGYYVLRIGEGSYSDIISLKDEINKGIVRKCDYIPQRIVISNVESNSLDNKPALKITQAKSIEKKIINKVSDQNGSKGDDQGVLISRMYKALNAGDLITAKNIAGGLIDTNPQDAYNVLGIVSMKMGKWDKACEYLKKTSNKKLADTACYTYNLKAGYSYLQKNPSVALEFFQNAQTYKNNKDVLLGMGYAYLNMNQLSKALEIFQSLYEKYPNDKAVIGGYIAALYNAKDYNKLEELKRKLPADYASLFKKYDTYIALNKVNELLKKKKYMQAESILLDLYKKNPDNVNVLLTLGNLYFQTNQLDKAENFYNNVLLINSDNIYALQGLRGIAAKRGDFKKALEYSDKLRALGIDVDDTKIKSLYYLRLARESMKAKDCQNAYKYATLAKKEDETLAEAYMILGDYYTFCQKDKRRAFLNYEKGYQYAKNNFDMKLKFLYSLLHYDMFTQIKIVLETIDPSKLTPVQKEDLRKFYSALYVKFASYKFKNKEYKTAIKVCEEGLKYDSANPALYEIAGWSCFRLKNYKCAKDYFQKSVALSNSEKTKYALALAYLNLGEKEKAVKILDSIASTKDPDLRVKIADAYVSLGEVSKAERLLKSIRIKTRSVQPQYTPQDVPVPIIKKQDNGEFFPDVLDSKANDLFYKKTVLMSINDLKPVYVKNKYTSKLKEEYQELQEKILLSKSNYLNNVEVGLNLRTKSGTTGLGQLSDLLFYFKGDYFLGTKKKIYAKLGFLNLSSGNVENYAQVGASGGYFIDDWLTDYTGFMPKIGFSYSGEKIFNIELGTTPIGDNPISYAYVGRLAVGARKKSEKYLLTFSRSAVKDSILSYVGNNDPYSDRSWGRVLDNEVKFEYEKTLDKNDSMFYVAFSIGYLDGENVNENEKYEINLFPLKYWGNNILDYDYLGLFSMVQIYKHNENSFLYYRGGYFSPKSFFLFAPRYEGYAFDDEKQLGVKAFIMGGPLFYDEDNAQMSLALEAGIYAKYILSDSIVLKGGADLRRSGDYTDVYVNFALQYYFGKKLYITKSELNHNMKEMLRTW